MRGAFVCAVALMGLSSVAAYPYPQQPVALPPHLLRQYLSQQQQQQQQPTPIYETDAQPAPPQYTAVSTGHQIRNNGVQGLVQRAQAQAPPQYSQYQQPQYVAQAQPQAYRPKAQQQARPRPLVRPQELEEENLEEDGPSPNYEFGFDVNDDHFTNYQNRKEEKQGDVVKGSYSVVDSDGFIRTVTYTADPKEGFKAEVVRKPTDIVVKVPTKAPPTEQSALRHQQAAQYLEASSRPQQHQQHQQPQQYYRYQQ